jgi:transcriptional regulator with XRE-family HTH domain
MSDVRERFRAWFTSQSWTQVETAKRLGVTQPAIWAILSRNGGVTLALAHRIEKLSASWEHGPIRTEEWLGEDAVSADEVGDEPEEATTLSTPGKPCDD